MNEWMTSNEGWGFLSSTEHEFYWAAVKHQDPCTNLVRLRSNKQLKSVDLYSGSELSQT